MEAAFVDSLAPSTHLRLLGGASVCCASVRCASIILIEIIHFGVGVRVMPEKFHVTRVVDPVVFLRISLYTWATKH